MRKHGSPKIITTDKLPSYGAAFREIGVADRQLCGGRSNNRCENSHLPFRRRERAISRLAVAAPSPSLKPTNIMRRASYFPSSSEVPLDL